MTATVRAASAWRWSAPSTLWIWTLVLGPCLIAGLWFVPSVTSWEPASDLYYASVSLLATAAIAAGVVVHRPSRPLPWILLAAGQLSYTVADMLFFVEVLRDTYAFPDVPDVFYLLQFPLVIAALALFVRRRTPHWQLATWIDVAVLGTAASLVWWVYLVAPLTVGRPMPTAELVVTVAYPVMDLLMLAMALRLALGGGGRPTSYRLLVASLAVMLIGDAAYTLNSAGGTWINGGWVDGTWLFSYTLGAAAALHPSMRVLDTTAPARPPTATARRLAMLAIGSVLAPVVMLVQDLRGQSGHESIVAVTCIVLFLLVLARMAGLVSVQQLSAITDALTGLRNRGYFTESLRTECWRARRTGRRLGLLLIDADHFKSINDTYGHPAGDQTLVEIANRLRTVCRVGDVVARYGGEEFAILLPATTQQYTVDFAERMRAAVSATPIAITATDTIDVTVSIGAATLSGPMADVDTLIQAADTALYEAKRNGRNRVVLAGQASTPVPAPV